MIKFYKIKPIIDLSIYDNPCNCEWGDLVNALNDFYNFKESKQFFINNNCNIVQECNRLFKNSFSDNVVIFYRVTSILTWKVFTAFERYRGKHIRKNPSIWISGKECSLMYIIDVNNIIYLNRFGGPAVISYDYYSGLVNSEKYYIMSSLNNRIGPAFRNKTNGVWDNSFFINNKMLSLDEFTKQLERL